MELEEPAPSGGGDRPTPEERAVQYKPGSIRRVRLKNFLTYADVEFCPGPRCVLVCYEREREREDFCGNRIGVGIRFEGIVIVYGGGGVCWS